MLDFGKLLRRYQLYGLLKDCLRAHRDAGPHARHVFGNRCSRPPHESRFALFKGEFWMRQYIALAGCACLLSAGCANSGMMGRNRSNVPGHVATSQRALRPTITRDFRRPEGFDVVKHASYDAECGACEECPTCGCPADQCSCGSACGAGCDACGGKCRCFIEGIASGGCGGCGLGGPGGGICPNAGGYPEYPSFNPGPATGQVAYPYYTVRGPRDFLRDNPPSIGPY
jgi:hypothetical protein